MRFLAEHWLTILGASAVSWSLFALGRLWESDHPRDGFSFTPDETWQQFPSATGANREREMWVRRGPYDQDWER